MLLKPVLDWMFKLPPVERRSIIEWPWLERNFFGKGSLRKDCDDLYIYFLTFKWSFVIACILAAIYITSYFTGVAIDLNFFVIDLTGADFVEKSLKSYPYHLTNILLFIVLPYYLLMFRYYFNPRTYDLRSWNPKASELGPIKPLKTSAAGVGVLVVFSMIMYRSGGIFISVMNTSNVNGSSAYMLTCLIVISFIYATFNRILLMSILVFWHFAGKRTVGD